MNWMVERVAAAIMAAEYGADYYPYSDAIEVEKNEYRRMARAAIAAMREPLPAMIEAAQATDQMKIIDDVLTSQQMRTGKEIAGLGDGPADCALADAYRAMIDAAHRI